MPAIPHRSVVALRHARCLPSTVRITHAILLYSQRLVREATAAIVVCFQPADSLLPESHRSRLVSNAFASSRREIGMSEWQACSAAGVSAPHVVVGGVSKSEEFLSSICRSGPAAVVLDSMVEWRRLQRVLSVGRSAPVLLRINPGISRGGLNMAGGSQFGLDRSKRSHRARMFNDSPAQFLDFPFYFAPRVSCRRDLEALRSAGGCEFAKMSSFSVSLWPRQGRSISF